MQIVLACDMVKNDLYRLDDVENHAAEYDYLVAANLSVI